MPMYMCHDACYCSVACRKQGRSVEYTQLMGIKEEHAECASMYSSVMSESTATSSKRTSEAHGQGGGHGVLRWILSAGLRQLAAIAGGAEVLRMGSFATPRVAWCPVVEDPAGGAGRVCSSEGFLDMAISEHDKASCADFVRLIEGNA